MKPRFKFHVFSCQNLRPAGGRPSCGGRGAAALLRALRSRLLRDPDLCTEAEVTAAACLGPCFDGPVLVVYPEGVWYAGVKEADIDEVIESHFRRGLPVERLRCRFAGDPDDREGMEDDPVAGR